MGRVYRPIEVSCNHQRRITVGLVDTGADETVVSQRLANEVGVSLYGNYTARCASQYTLQEKYADVTITDLVTGKSIIITVGVSDVPFHTDDIDDEGLEVILGIDFIQETNMEIKA